MTGPDEFDKFLAQEHPENGNSISMEQVNLALGTAESILVAAMGELNQLNIAITRVHPTGPVMWSTVIHGTPLIMDDFYEFIAAVARHVR